MIAFYFFNKIGVPSPQTNHFWLIINGLPQGVYLEIEAVDQLLAEERFSASAVIDRMKEAMGVDSDADLAWWFGTSPQSLSNKKGRNSVPYREAVFVAHWTRSSLTYILTGEGDLDDAT